MSIKIIPFIVIIFTLCHLVQKEEKCLIIKKEDSQKRYKIINHKNDSEIYFLLIDYLNVPPEPPKTDNPLVNVERHIPAKGASYTLINKKKLYSLPNGVDTCNCITLSYFDYKVSSKYMLGDNFTLYLEGDKYWEVYNAYTDIVDE